MVQFLSLRLCPALALVAISVSCSLMPEDDFEFTSKLLSEPVDDGVSKHVDSIEKPKEFKIATDRTTAELMKPVRLMADGEPIDIGKLSSIAHAGPCIADVDGDGDRDLLVGDFPGYFWYFRNEGDDAGPLYASVGKLQAGGVDAKTPVY